MWVFNKLILIYWSIGLNKKCVLNFYLLKVINLIGNIYFRCYCLLFPLTQKLNRNNSEIIISLTSIPSRIDSIWCVMESIFRQTKLPDRILLYLSTNQFKNNSTVLEKLNKYVDLGLEVIFFQEDLGPHKKYFYTFSSYPKSKVITIDDDIIYSFNFIEHLISIDLTKYSVVGNVYSRYTFLDEFQNHFNYSIPIGAGGILYDVSKLDLSLILNKDAIIETALYQDDLWLYFINLFSGVKIHHERENYLIFPCRKLFALTNESNLTEFNVFQNKNQQAYNNIMKYLKIFNHKT